MSKAITLQVRYKRNYQRCRRHHCKTTKKKILMYNVRQDEDEDDDDDNDEHFRAARLNSRHVYTTSL